MQQLVLAVVRTLLVVRARLLSRHRRTRQVMFETYLQVLTAYELPRLMEEDAVGFGFAIFAILGNLARRSGRVAIDFLIRRVRAKTAR